MIIETNMMSKKSKKSSKRGAEKIHDIYRRFSERMNKLENDRKKLVADFMANADKKEVEKLKKDIDNFYK